MLFKGERGGDGPELKKIRGKKYRTMSLNEKREHLYSSLREKLWEGDQNYRGGEIKRLVTEGKGLAPAAITERSWGFKVGEKGRIFPERGKGELDLPLPKGKMPNRRSN